MRESAFEKFEHVGFPTVQEEDWKYTNVAPIARTHFSPVLDGNQATHGDDRRFAAFFYDEARHSQLVFVNGVFQKDLSSLETLPPGVVAVDFAEALRDGQYETIVREHFERNANNENGFTALNTA